MPLLDWLRGKGTEPAVREETKDPEAARMEARKGEQSLTGGAGQPDVTAEGVEERRHEEAARHSGI